MSLRRLLTQTATVISREPVGVDEYGNPTEGPEIRASYPARLEQTDSAELLADRDTVTTRWRLFLPAEAVIDAWARVEVDGELFDVIGRPTLERTPRGPHHVEALLRATV